MTYYLYFPYSFYGTIKVKNAIKKFMSTLFAVLIILSFSSYQHDKNSIGKNSVSMDNITQNNKNGYISFNFDIPKGWISNDDVIQKVE